MNINLGVNDWPDKYNYFKRSFAATISNQIDPAANSEALIIIQGCIRQISRPKQECGLAL